MQTNNNSNEPFGSEILRRGEKLVPLGAAGQFYPPKTRGRLPHRSTAYRHATIGIRGVVLETVQCAGIRATSKEAVQRFFAELTRQAGVTRTSPTSPQIAAAAANERLKQIVFRRVDSRKQSTTEGTK